MRLFEKSIAPLLLGAVLTSTAFMAGCAVHARVYDADHGDYHVWTGETVYYNQWEHNTHRDHRDYNKRSANEQKEYWNWRHSHGDNH